MAAPPTVWTVGHSTRILGEFLSLLHNHRIDLVGDVRTVPRSRRHPHFSAEPLAASLAAAGIGYLHMPAVGGLRKPRPDSPNTAWRDDAFKGYADYMETPLFAAGLRRVIDAASSARTALMCAEADWRQCHRSLLSDALKVRGWRVIHIGGKAGPEEHPYTPQASVENGRLSYAPPALFPVSRAKPSRPTGSPGRTRSGNTRSRRS